MCVCVYDELCFCVYSLYLCMYVCVYVCFASKLACSSLKDAEATSCACLYVSMHDGMCFFAFVYVCMCVCMCECFGYLKAGGKFLCT